ncbi:hypothetical protein [Cohnella cellulosilytica]
MGNTGEIPHEDYKQPNNQIIGQEGAKLRFLLSSLCILLLAVLLGCAKQPDPIAIDYDSSLVPVQVQFNGKVYQTTSETGTCTKEKEIGKGYALSEEGEILERIYWRVFQEADGRIAVKATRTCYIFTE